MQNLTTLWNALSLAKVMLRSYLIQHFTKLVSDRTMVFRTSNKLVEVDYQRTSECFGYLGFDRSWQDSVWHCDSAFVVAPSSWNANQRYLIGFKFEARLGKA